MICTGFVHTADPFFDANIEKALNDFCYENKAHVIDIKCPNG